MPIPLIATGGVSNGVFNTSIGNVTLGGFGGPALEINLTGTALLGMTEGQVETGGRTIIATATGDTWQPAGAAFDAQRQAIINGFSAPTSPPFGWNTQVRDNIPVTSVVRTSDNVVTITLPAAPDYAVDASEFVTGTLPGSALVLATGDVVATPDIQIDPDGTRTFNVVVGGVTGVGTILESP
jgi:hypothetical protein